MLLFCAATLTFPLHRSVIRNIAKAVLRLLTTPQHSMPDFPWHQDVYYNNTCMSVSFLWRPFAANTTEMLSAWAHSEAPAPDVVVTGAMLWDVLHMGSVEEYAQLVRVAALAIQFLLEQVRLVLRICTA
jgi:hypothetical protein